MAITLTDDRRTTRDTMRQEALNRDASDPTPVYVIPAAEADSAAAAARQQSNIGMALAVVCVVFGIITTLIGITTSSGVISIPWPDKDHPISFSGVPIGLMFVFVGLAFFYLARPQVKAST